MLDIMYSTHTARYIQEHCGRKDGQRKVASKVHFRQYLPRDRGCRCDKQVHSIHVGLCRNERNDTMTRTKAHLHAQQFSLIEVVRVYPLKTERVLPV
jgi:hypothetical protein